MWVTALGRGSKSPRALFAQNKRRDPLTKALRMGTLPSPSHAMEKNPISPQGLVRLQHELHHLKTVERPTIIQAVATAREDGDLKENAEYHAAREKHSFIEGRIKELVDKISRAEVIDPATISGTRVAFGARVTMVNADTEEEIKYRILGADETDPRNGIIGIASPVARALLGKEAGDEVKIRTPGGERTYEVVAIEYS